MKSLTRVAFVAALIIILLFFSFASIGPGHTGVVTKFGAVSENVLQEGLHFKIPLVTKIIAIDNRVARVDVEAGSASKDLQTITATISVNYRVDRNSSAKIYKNVGKKYEDVVVRPAIQECVKSTTAKYNAEELITKRQDVGEQMKLALIDKIQPYGLSIEVFNIINFGFSEEFDKAIESKQTAQQLALKAEQDLARVKIEAEQKIAQAQAEAESLKVQKQEITPELLQLRQIEVLKEKWNGQLPTTVYIGDGSKDTTLLSIPLK